MSWGRAAGIHRSRLPSEEVRTASSDRLSAHPHPQEACFLPRLGFHRKMPPFRAPSLEMPASGKRGQKGKAPLSSMLWVNPDWPSLKGPGGPAHSPSQPRSDGRWPGQADPTAWWLEAKGGSCLREGRSCELIQEIKGGSILFS